VAKFVIYVLWLTWLVAEVTGVDLFDYRVSATDMLFTHLWFCSQAV